MSDLVAHLHVKFCTINALLKHCVLIAYLLKYLHRVLLKVPGWCFKDRTLSDLVAHLHVKFCTINALLKHYVLIASRQCFNSVLV